MVYSGPIMVYTVTRFWCFLCGLPSPRVCSAAISAKATVVWDPELCTHAGFSLLLIAAQKNSLK